MAILDYKFKVGLVWVGAGGLKTWQRDLTDMEGNREPLKRPAEDERDRPLSIHLIFRRGNWELEAEVTAQVPHSRS